MGPDRPIQRAGETRAGLRRDRYDQRAYAEHALGIARVLGGIVAAIKAERGEDDSDASESDDDRTTFNLLIYPEEDQDERIVPGSAPPIRTEKQLADQLAAYRMQVSMSRTGNCFDNAPMESFFATLKTELVHHRQYITRAEAKTDIFEYIEVFYNRSRRHSALDYLSPVAFEHSFC